MTAACVTVVPRIGGVMKNLYHLGTRQQCITHMCLMCLGEPARSLPVIRGSRALNTDNGSTRHAIGSRTYYALYQELRVLFLLMKAKADCGTGCCVLRAAASHDPILHLSAAQFSPVPDLIAPRFVQRGPGRGGLGHVHLFHRALEHRSPCHVPTSHVHTAADLPHEASPRARSCC